MSNPLDKVQALFWLDAEAGRLRERADRYKGANRILVRRANEVASWTDAIGYRRLGIGRQQILEHVAIWAMAHGEWPSTGLDHVNGDPQDNRLCNLRLSSCGQNIANSKERERKQDLPRGVYLGNRSRRFSVQFRKNGKLLRFGLYETLAEAEEAAKTAHLGLHGEFSFYARDMMRTAGRTLRARAALG